jgi:predicted type IV restriction endonuclease
MVEDFKARLIQHSKTIVERAPRATTEAATQQYLILPFFQLLAYDPLNPDEIVPEAHASFSDKFKNRVDYAICKDKQPVIAIECKCTGKLSEANRGELKGYFNAVPTVKLGILTDGLIYELYSDTGLENMMDDEPFIRVDLAEVARERIDDNALDALQKLRKGTFDPADVGADAKRKIYLASYVDALESSFREPGEVLVKAMMDLASIEGRRTNRLVEEHTPLVTEALQLFLDKKILERVGFAERQDLVRMPAATPASSAPSTNGEPSPPPPSSPVDESGVVTTETELAVFDYVRTRLSFLVKEDDLFQKLKDLRWVDRRTIFTVFYKQERKGRMFNFREGSDPKYRFEFPDVEEPILTNELAAIDEPLLVTFHKRVEELG